MGILTRDMILQAQDLKTEDVPVPEWGGDVRVRTLTGAEREQFGRSMLGADGKTAETTGYAFKMLALCIVDEAGVRQFSDADVAALGAKSADALQRVFTVAEKLNGMASDSVEIATGN